MEMKFSLSQHRTLSGQINRLTNRNTKSEVSPNDRKTENIRR